MMTLDKRARTPIVVTPFEDRNATVSPDGRFMAYESSESGQGEIFVTKFPDLSGGRWQISTNGGVRPQWSYDGKELFYEQQGAGQVPSGLYVSSISSHPTFSHGTPVKLFDLRGYPAGAGGRPWDVSRDGKRFIVIKNEATRDVPTTGADRPSFVFIVNWIEELKAKLNR